MSIHDHCIVCRAELLVEPGPPHCVDCHPSEEHLQRWYDLTRGIGYRKALLHALAAYLEEYEADGYNRSTFVDYVVNELFVGGLPMTLSAWYRERADQLDAERDAALARARER